MTAITYTLWLNKSGTQKRDKTQTWPEFCQWLQNLPPAKIKEDCQLIKLATFGDKRTPKGCLRSDDNVIGITGIEGDYDDGVMTPEQAVALLEAHNLRATIAPTFTAGPDNPRWRVLTPLGAPITPAERLRYVEALNGMLGGVLASESATLSQSYFIGVPAGAPYTVIHTFDDPEEGYTLDELELLEGIDQHRQPLKTKKQKANGDSGGSTCPFDDSEFEDWVNEIRTGEEVHPNVIRIAGRFVAKGWTDEDIRLFFAPLADRVESERGKERADLLRGKELDDAIASAREKGYAPRDFAEILRDAKELTKESDPDAILREIVPLPAIQKRRVREAIKKATGLPFSVMEEAEKGYFDDDGGTDDLQLARSLVQEIGRDDVLAADTFVWQWLDCIFRPIMNTHSGRT